jgi:hypothetical protein
MDAGIGSLYDAGRPPFQEAQQKNQITGTTARQWKWVALALVSVSILAYFLANLSLLLNFITVNFSEPSATKPFRVLYVVASMSEYQHGGKSKAGVEDRFANTFVPIVCNTVHSLVSKYPAWDVDVYLIIAYNLRQERFNYLRNRLPEGVGLQIWENAISLYYDGSKGDRLKPNLHSMNRQHRFVLRDKLDFYDLFIVGEDDMAINSAHVNQYLKVQREIDRLRKEAQEREWLKGNTTKSNSLFYGNLSSVQLGRMIPGFIRVEVYSTDRPRNQTTAGYTMLSSEEKELKVDPSPCCHFYEMDNRTSPFYRLPPNPKSNQLFIWETAIQALGVRKFPESSYLGWVAYLPGVVNDQLKPATDFYWSGRSGILGKGPVRPSPHHLHFFAHQAMYIMTRDQMLRLDTQLCQGRFLPPFSSVVRRNGIFWPEDELFLNSAEFMVGGLQLYTQGAKNAEKAGCNLQRVVSLSNFSNHLVYHISNNKQRTIDPSRHVLADDLLRQLSFVQRKASMNMTS